MPAADDVQSPPTIGSEGESGLPSSVRAGRAVATGAVIVAVALAGSCSRALKTVVAVNQRPVVEITQAPVSGGSPASYAYEISWAGSDPDGRISSFRYVIDPPSAPGSDTVWVPTHKNRGTFVFTADSVVGANEMSYHTFVVEALDDHLLASAPAWASFTSSTIAPTVRISFPTPSLLLERKVPPSTRIRWVGTDPDGLGSRLPSRYKWRVFTTSTYPSLDAILADPSVLPRTFAPTFDGWATTPGVVDSVDLHDLTPGQDYIFVVVAIDTVGAYSPVFRFDTNILQFGITTAASGVAPRITISGNDFTYTYPQSGILSDPSKAYTAEFSAELPVQLRWSAVPTPGAYLRGYRWALDIASIDDETPRTNESTDLGHWSQWSNQNSVTFPPWQPPPGSYSVQHMFYLEAQDDIGLTSLVMVNMVVSRPSYDKALLIVDDTWMSPDHHRTNPCADPPPGYWPSAAELDTFLYAVGNVPWRCYGDGVNTVPGLFAGYGFDTLGTHFQKPGNLSLTLLNRYRNVIWMTDEASAFGGTAAYNVLSHPIPYIRTLSQPGVLNPLGKYLQQGGRLWISGGGFALASLIDYNKLGSPNNIYANVWGELVPGRFMYDYTHWRSEVTVNPTTGFAVSPRAVGGWLGAPDYTQLPPLLTAKSDATDPVPPQRTGQTFFSTTTYAEYLSQPNSILEPADGVAGDSTVSMLDTLYTTGGGPALFGHPAMTLYHGHDHGMVIFSGFPLWYFQRAQGIALVDWVLQDVWHMPRQAVQR